MQAAREVRGDKAQVGAPGNDNRSSLAPPRGCRTGQAADGNQDHQQRPGQTQVHPGPADAPVSTAAAGGEQQVARALRTALGTGIEDNGGEQAEHEHRAGVAEREAQPARPPADPAIGVGEHRVRDQRRGSGIQDQPRGEDGRTGCRVAPLQQEPGERRRDQDRADPGLARAHPGGKPHREERIAGDQLGSSRERRAAAEGIPGPAPGHSEREHAEPEPGRQNGEPHGARHAPILAGLSRSDNRDGRRSPGPGVPRRTRATPSPAISRPALPIAGADGAGTPVADARASRPVSRTAAPPSPGYRRPAGCPRPAGRQAPRPGRTGRAARNCAKDPHRRYRRPRRRRSAGRFPA